MSAGFFFFFKFCDIGQTKEGPRQTFLARRYLEMAKKLAIKQIERLEYG